MMNLHPMSRYVLFMHFINYLRTYSRSKFRLSDWSGFGRKIILLYITFCIYGCEKDSVIELPPYASRLVIDGWIEQGKYPTVILTRSASYFDKVDSTSIRKLVVSTAKVTISDGTQEEVLTLRRKNDYFPHFIYQGTALKGETGKTYYLQVESEGATYSATTTIPAPVSFDSLWFEHLPEKDSLGFLWARFSDNAEQENYYRIFTKRKGQDSTFIPVYLSAMGDQFFNGETLNFSLLRGAKTFSNVTDDLYFQTGDSVEVKLCAIDKAHFDFWRTLERELFATSNPFSSSGNEIISNIQGGALGIWGGYGATYHFLIAK